MHVSIWSLDGIPEITPGDDLVEAIRAAAGADIRDGDILVITSKIVSKAEGRIVAADDRERAITDETVRIVATRVHPNGVTRIVENRLGIIGAAAGVDASNTTAGTVLLLPVDPDRSAKDIASRFRAEGIEVGVILSDTLGRPWREGQTDIAIGAAGVHVFEELQGTLDAAGHVLAVSRPCVADEIAAAAELVKGKADGRPVAIVRGLDRWVGPLDLPGARSIVRPHDRDLFSLGSEEARAEGFTAGLAAATGDAGSSSVPPDDPS